MTVSLDGIDLVIFDKDGTLIDFGAMWSGWALTLAANLQAATGRSIDEPLFEMLGYDPVAHVVRPGGGLAATPMARLRERTRSVLLDLGLAPAVADRALDEAWHAPDPVESIHPLADLESLLGRLRATGRRIAIATSDDREPTVRTLDALDIASLVDAVVCADDGIPVKPDPAMVEYLCRTVGVDPARVAVIGDSPADIAMGRSAGARLVIGVLTGVGRRDDLAPLADVVIASVAELATG